MIHQNIAIVGIGGAGRNFLINLPKDTDFSCRLIAIDTDSKALGSFSTANEKIYLQDDVHPPGSDANGNTDTGRRIATSCLGTMITNLQSYQIVACVAGLGRGTGSGVMPVFAKELITQGKNVVCVAIMPFHFEGKALRLRAENVLSEMKQGGIPVLTLDNQDLHQKANEHTTFAEAFKSADAAIWAVLKELAADGFDGAHIQAAQTRLAQALMDACKDNASALAVGAASGQKARQRA